MVMIWAIAKAIEEAKAETDKPSIIEVKTIIGYGARKDKEHQLSTVTQSVKMALIMQKVFTVMMHRHLQFR